MEKEVFVPRGNRQVSVWDGSKNDWSLPQRIKLTKGMATFPDEQGDF